MRHRSTTKGTMKPKNELRLIKQIKSAEKKLNKIDKQLNKIEKRWDSQKRVITKLWTKLERLEYVNLKAETEQIESFGVKFTRRKAITYIKGKYGWENSPGRYRVSDRRFATQKEAVHHGKRFTKIENHKSFSVFKSNDEANAYVNWRTGKTNPMIGLKRKR